MVRSVRRKLVGAATTVGTGYSQTAAWFAVTGLEPGCVPPAAMDTALSAVSRERHGAGTALIQMLRQAGGAIGGAVLGTVINVSYRRGART